MMTLYLLFEEIERGRLSYQSRIGISEAAAMQPPSKLGLEPGSEISVLDAARALIARSANDVAVAVAEHIGGSERRFANLMTARARTLGMRGTVFRNASGLPDEAQITTARDMITLSLRLYDDFPRHYRLFATNEFRYAGVRHINHNALLRNFSGTDGIKTGYTRASGFNLVSSVKRENRHVVAVYFGGESAKARDEAMRRLLRRALAQASTVKTRRPAVMAAVMAGGAQAEARGSSSSNRQLPQLGRANTPARRQAGSDNSQAVALIPEPTGTVSESANQAGVTLKEPRVELARVRPVPVTAPIGAEAQRTERSTLVPSTVPAATLARPPSTLGAQARALGGPTPEPELALPTASKAQNTLHVGTLAVQVGAFVRAEDAQRQLEMVLQRAREILGSGAPEAVEGRSGGRMVYRARFVGYDAAGAAQVCNELRRRQLDCFVTR